MADTTDIGAPAPASGFGLFEAGLYALTLLGWGTSWYALKLNAATSVAGEVSVLYRFIFAAVFMTAWAWIAGKRRHHNTATHVRFVVMGAAIFSFNFLIYYYASAVLTSGLLAVMFSTVSILNILVAACVSRTLPDWRIVLAAIIGFVGIVAVFWPEVSGATLARETLLTILTCLFANCLFVTGNMMSARVQAEGVSVVEANARGMVWGVIVMALFIALKGTPVTFEWSVVYVSSLVYLAIMSTVVAFMAYLTLLGRIGPGRVGYLTVLFPIVALGISTLLEGYQWTLPALVGLVLVLIGNGLVIASTGKRA